MYDVGKIICFVQQITNLIHKSEQYIQLLISEIPNTRTDSTIYPILIV